MRKLLQSTYRSDPKFERARHRKPADGVRQFDHRILHASTYVEPTVDRRSGERSGMAYSAGFSGLIFLFRYSFFALVFDVLGFGPVTATWIVLAWSLSAPLAIVMGFVAARELDRSRMQGRAPAFIGFIIGVFGTVKLLAEIDRWLRL